MTARRRRRRARAARGRQRQVGGALEDGAHRAPGLGTRGRAQPARAVVPAPHLHRRATPRASAPRAGAAHRARRARPAVSVALQYGNAFGQGFQAAALKPADFFGNDDVLYLMEDMATGEIRLSILWEWLHKGARFTDADAATGAAPGDPFTPGLFDAPARRGVRQAPRRAATATSTTTRRTTTLPIAREIVEAYVAEPDQGRPGTSTC